MRGSRKDERIDIVGEWEEALDIDMPNLGNEMMKLLDEFNGLMSGEKASILTQALDLPFGLLEAFTKRERR